MCSGEQRRKAETQTHRHKKKISATCVQLTILRQKLTKKKKNLSHESDCSLYRVFLVRDAWLILQFRSEAGWMRRVAPWEQVHLLPRDETELLAQTNLRHVEVQPADDEDALHKERSQSSMHATHWLWTWWLAMASCEGHHHKRVRRFQHQDLCLQLVRRAEERFFNHSLIFSCKMTVFSVSGFVFCARLMV